MEMQLKDAILAGEKIQGVTPVETGMAFIFESGKVLVLPITAFQTVRETTLDEIKAEAENALASIEAQKTELTQKVEVITAWTILAEEKAAGSIPS